MKPLQKYIIIFVGFLIFLTLGYIGLQKSNMPISQSDIGITTTQSSTPKLAPVLSGSENAWGNNPFQTGNTHTGEIQKPVIPKIVFHKPNTEWKTRTLSGITYIFGEGNPKEVALSIEGLQQELRQCEITPESIKRLCREGMYGYVTPQVEQALKQALESPLWEQLINRCSSEQVMNPEAFDIFKKNILTPGALHISRFLIIDPDSGRKELDIFAFDNIYRAIVGIGIDTHDVRNADVRPTTEGIFYPCSEKYGKPLAQMLENIKVLYSTTISIMHNNNRFPTTSEVSQSLNNGLPIPVFFINP